MVAFAYLVWEIYAFRLVLIISSTWACFALVGPHPFLYYPEAFALPARIMNERGWGIVFGVSALTKATGLGLLICNFAKPAAWYLQIVGMAISAVCWPLFGASALLGNPDSLFGMTGVCMGLSALISLAGMVLPTTLKR